VASQNTNLAAGLANGSYSVEFTTTFNANQWTGSLSQFNATTATSTGSFTVVPAPGALTLLGVAGLIGARRRR
jgi:MYXO-CTERM domain-containing protein